MSILLSNSNPQTRANNPPIVAQTPPPTTGPRALRNPVGTVWIDASANVVYMLTSFENGQAVWVNTIPAAAGTFTSLTVNPGPTAITGEFRVDANVNEAEVIRLREDGGPAGTIEIASLQGTGADSVKIQSVSGGIEMFTDANAPEGNMVISTDGGGTLTIGSTGDTGTNDLLINLNGGASSKLLINNELSTDVASIKMLSPLGGIEITTQDTLKNVVIDSELGFVVAGASATCKGVDILNITPLVDRTTTINTNVVSSAVTDQIDIGTGGVDTDAGAQKIINIGTGANLLGTQEVNISTGTASSGTKQVNIGNADALTQLNAIGVIGINATNSGATTIGNTISGGAVEVESTAAITLQSTLTSAASINLNASGAAGGVTIQSGNNGITETSTGAISITSSDGLSNAITLAATGAGGGVSIAPTNTTVAVDIANVVPTVARTVTVSGGTVGSAVADVLNLATGATSFAGASKVVNLATGNNTNGTDTVNISTGTAASGTKAVNMGNADGLTTITELGVMNINTSGPAATTIGNSTAGGAIALATNTSVRIDAKTASHFTVTGAADLTLSSTGGSVAVTSSQAAATAVNITAPAGGVTLSGGAAATLGNVGIVNQAQAAAAGPNATVTVVNNSRVGSITFSGYTQASSATLVLTLTNSFITATSPIIASTQNAGTNDAQMQITRIKQGSGTADITIKNQGAAALNGDMVMSFIILA